MKIILFPCLICLKEQIGNEKMKIFSLLTTEFICEF